MWYIQRFYKFYMPEGPKAVFWPDSWFHPAPFRP
ncbi:hypothetical protein EYZ11_012936 [Aspergillus tanneri]|uniref:Uncharacterized protein n=1 Tax=Aspergillus tanneri TaxID=1220188 RepID=A0A4S3IZ75_9EURO|nr:hypothetical protein EYZ11_012936 [Aspergillus tanneri]